MAGEDVKIPIAAMSKRATTMVEYMIAPVSDEKYGFYYPIRLLMKGFRIDRDIR
jgi:hypothetical protein